MSSRRNSLSPPSRTHTGDPGAHDLDTSDSEEHFSDAQSGLPDSPHPTSPIPRTRVERVDDKPAYGEVPGTSAYQMREEDAAPDEIAYIPDLNSESQAAPDTDASPPTPGGQPIPKTVVEEAPDVDGSVTHPEIEKKHVADPQPDVILKADGQKIVEDGGAPDTPISPTLKTPTSPHARRKSSLALKRSPLSPASPGLRSPRSPAFPSSASGGEDDGFGDDFDDFEEGEDDGDFDDFDDGFQPAEEDPVPALAPEPAPPPVAPPPSSLSFPVPDFNGLEASEIYALTEPYLNALFPPEDATPPLLPALSKDNPIFQTPRSASLWSQLVAPPPLQPPDWIRSRIRRLFLVSLGVPVDLDEILPASKQKKLVLPSLHRVSSTGSLRTSSESRSLSRVRHGESRRTSVDSQGNLKPHTSRTAAAAATAAGGASRPALPDPSFDLTTARQLCAATDEALQGMTFDELKGHVTKLEAMQGTALELLEYWQRRTDEKIGDREAFEGVIENLVKHARKVRK
ncbi:hypothetical protein B0H67DRAFT_679330 [Lasiosphaeris hirsuta]|uniref:Uncharacterized protein n=1 Tax=Lasiosphaeris hirsuta TaxID=260670 RepID=A0AA40BCJ7_9PEZI|nr:hypothetical protein B0H67DRAFT_679330 [Lasiosphaeris hirsuta]